MTGHLSCFTPIPETVQTDEKNSDSSIFQSCENSHWEKRYFVGGVWTGCL